MNRRRVSACLGVAVAGAVVAYRARRRATMAAAGPQHASVAVPGACSTGRGHLRLIVALHLYALLILAWPWDWVWDKSNDVWNKIKDWVREAIDGVVGLMTDLLGAAGALLRILGGAALQVLNAIENVATTLIPAVLNQVWGWLMNVQANAWTWVQSLRDEIGGWLKPVWDVLNNLWGHIFPFVRDVIDGFWRDVVAPIRWAVDHVWDAVFPFVRDVISTFWRDVVGPIADSLHQLWANFAEVTSWVLGVRDDVMTLIRGLLHIARFIITHPLDWWMIALEKVFADAPQWLAHRLYGVVAHNADDIDERLAQWIAS